MKNRGIIAVCLGSRIFRMTNKVQISQKGEEMKLLYPVGIPVAPVWPMLFSDLMTRLTTLRKGSPSDTIFGIVWNA